MTDQPTDARARLLSHFNQIKDSQHPQKWDELWREDFLPWDKGFPNPALLDLLNEHHDLFEVSSKGDKGKALVPGCGKGYDVVLLAAHGYEAYGLESSPRALEAARNNEKETNGKGIYATKGELARGTVTFVEGDFFKDDFLKDVHEGGKFDLIYDYTFLSALPPSMRPAWSKRMVELLSPTGRLVCIEFPTYKPPETGGPPWGLPFKVYKHHLERPGELLPYDSSGDLVESGIEASASPSGLVQVARFQPKRTHQIGYSTDGKVTDWVSLWTRPKA